MHKKTLLLATALLALGASLPARADDAAPPAHGPRHDMPRDMPPPPLAIMLEDALPALQLSDAQQSLWLHAEQHDMNQQTRQQRSLQHAGFRLQEKLADTRLSLSQALRAASLAAPAMQPSAAWLAFFDSLSSQQAGIVRQVLQSPPPPVHDIPPPG
ncbi:hypothetical protein PQU95_02060 [Vogesella sp. DC21W]|uniref:LTXXQ motif family protein n=1 Tax=Vogesella aquatica TaxID=2984206 RepID=A0ABT5ITW2_9NEIS|nr:hypothetical protein [Vogesella aquatica]MDC7716007.1 hypothetical protein [Vogesella aquatica]